MEIKEAVTEHVKIFMAGNIEDAKRYCREFCFAKEGDRILDTHLGSGSSAIAAHYAGYDFVGCELDEDYYNAAVKRFNNETKQQAMQL